MRLLSFAILLPQIIYGKQSWEVNERKSNSAIYGDMILTPLQQLRYGGVPVRGVARKESFVSRWPQNVVPYVLSDKYLESQKYLLKASLKALEAKSCFKFVERTNERDYLSIVPLDGCYSYVGKIGGRQTLSLAYDCLADYIIWHEVMHALGFEHEHQRPDRDQFIRVEYRNVDPDQITNFELLSENEVDYPDPYDYSSIMHYDGMAFGKIANGRRLATMIPLRKDIHLIDNMELSKSDLLKLNRLGNCGNSPTSISLNCVDTLPQCDQMVRKGLCKVPFYSATMAHRCPRGCGICRSSNIASPIIENQSCSDRASNCATFAANGFCTNEFYKDWRAKFCPKSCHLC